MFMFLKKSGWSDSGISLRPTLLNFLFKNWHSESFSLARCLDRMLQQQMRNAKTSPKDKCLLWQWS